MKRSKIVQSVFKNLKSPQDSLFQKIKLQIILEQLDIIFQGNGQKLITQTFDGANVMKGKKARVQAKIKIVYSNTHFIHCYAHQLNLIMRNAATITQNARIFFSNILAISTFFSRSQ